MSLNQGSCFLIEFQTEEELLTCLITELWMDVTARAREKEERRGEEER